MRTTIEIVRHFAAQQPAKPAVTSAAATYSYREILDAATAVARTLEHYEIRVVALAADNGPAWVAADLGAQIANVALVPLPSFFSAEQLAHALADSGADAVLADTLARRSLPALASDAALLERLDWGLLLYGSGWRRASGAPLETAKISYTSGTTGTPKGVCLTQRALDTVAQSLWTATAALGLTRHLCLLPLATLLENVAGIYAPLRNGAEIVAPSIGDVGLAGASGIDARALLACLTHYRPNSVILLPQMLAALIALLERGARCPAELRFAAVGGARVPSSLLERAERVGLPVYEGYGLTECASVVALNTPAARREGSVGHPLPHAHVRIGADGEIHVAGAVMNGYTRGAGPAPDEIATGDLGYIDDDGFLHVAGRRKNVFITSFGRNVSPEWVEAELAAARPIVQAAVFGEARPWSVAVLVAANGADADEIDAAVVAVNERLPDYARIGEWIRAAEPFTPANGLLTPNGRNRRAAIFERYGARIDTCYEACVEPLELTQGGIA